MRLKRLELSGFKSFAKNTVLEFPTAISAVVGPNGSGKSNVADAIRWVLGEQSIKTLRGKRGEDMIFNGSSSSPRMSKASVVLAFDNSKKEFPLEFEEVELGRRVYRDGQNEYLLNNSQVRLKDIIELLARVGFGSSQHHIIGQGEADRILYASPRERREMIEDALGLKIFQIKRLEAGRKLARTEENIRDAGRLRKEIQPHLKFLKSQAEKYELAAKIRGELKEVLTEYIARMAATLKAQFKKIQGERKEPAALCEQAEREILRMKEKLESAGSEEKRQGKEESRLEEKLKTIREARVAIEREAGRLEGIISFEEKRSPEGRDAAIPRKEVERALSDILSRIDKIRLGAAHGTESVLHAIKELHEHVAAFLSKMRVRREGRDEEFEEYRGKLKKLKVELEELKQEEMAASRGLASERGEGREEMETLRAEAKELYERERKAGRIRETLRMLDFEEEKVKLLQKEFEREVEEAKTYLGVPAVRETKPFASDMEAGTMKKKADRLKLKLEEAGGIDPETIKEYGAVRERDEFLEREVGDLVASAASLGQVMDELEGKLASEFGEGISRINDRFQEFFAVMFGGGMAALRVVKPKKRKHGEGGENDEDGEIGEDEGEEELGEGIEIAVDLPRKKIRSLDMLSGGERALTSIALLFAMSAVHPPPFLVLDETDAALDEANSQRYAKMLSDLSKTTQLIVITHNRITMKCAGVLYGVTMGQDGISKLLSIKFDEAEALGSQ